MSRIALYAGVLLAGSLYPLMRLTPWRLHAERQALLETLQRHPKLRIVKMESPDPERASLRIHLRVDMEDGDVITAFRRDLKTHPLLTKSFDSPIFEVNCVWSVALPNGAVEPLEFAVLFPAAGK